MINYLKDCQQTTLIGQLPDIINSNNESIKNEFNWIFDSSLNRLTKSVYTPTGSVKAHFGEFVNLSCEYITVKNIDSLKDSINSAVNEIVPNIIKNELHINSVILNPNNNHDNIYSKLVMNGLNYGTVLNAPEHAPHDGSIFVGWYDGDISYGPNTLVMQSEDLSLIAKWE